MTQQMIQWMSIWASGRQTRPRVLPLDRYAKEDRNPEKTHLMFHERGERCQSLLSPIPFQAKSKSVVKSEELQQVLICGALRCVELGFIITLHLETHTSCILQGSSSRLLQPAKSGGRFAYPREVKPEEEEDVPVDENLWAEHAEDSSYDSLSTNEDQSSDVDCPASSPTSPRVRKSSTADSEMHDGDAEIPIRGATACARHRPQADTANATTNCLASSTQVAHSPLSSDHSQTQMFDPCQWAIVKQEEEEDELQSHSEKSPSPPSANSTAI